MVTSGFNAGTRNGLAAMYNIRADHELGVGMIAVRRIPCACGGCLGRLQLPINQRYTGLCSECKYYQIFLGTNNWHIIKLAARKDCPDDDLEEAKMIVLDSMAQNSASEIQIGNIGAFETEDSAYKGYYLVEWTGLPFKSLHDHSLDEYNPPMSVKKDDLLVTARYLDVVPRAPNWWCPVDQTVTVRLQQILATNIQLIGHSATNPLPRSCNTAAAIRLGSKKISTEDCDTIMHQILMRSI